MPILMLLDGFRKNIVVEILTLAVFSNGGVVVNIMSEIRGYYLKCTATYKIQLLGFLSSIRIHGTH